MATTTAVPGPTLGKVLWIAIIVSLAAGAIGGFAAGFIAGTTPAQAPVLREFWVFTVVLPFNDSAPGMPSHDYFAPDRITVNRGDTVKIHFFNTEEEPEDHTFTMEAPYAMDHIVQYGQTENFTFAAGTPGIFPYRCLYHQPSMTGWLVVLQ